MKKKKRESAIQQASSIAMMPVDWSELPNDLLNLISQLFDNKIDLNSFRSICSNWRSASIPNQHRNIFTLQFPLFRPPFNIDSINNISEFRNLSKHGFFLIKPPQVGRHRRPWLFRITQNSTGKIQFHDPLLRRGLHSSSDPVFFDFNKFSLLHLATNFICIDEQMKLPISLTDMSFRNPTKAIAVTSHGNKPIILGTFACSRGCPVVFKCGDENWKAIPNMSAYFGDICVFKGRPYAVDNTGRTVTVELGPEDSTVQLVAQSLVGGGDIKFLVESDSDLLLADVYQRRFDAPDEHIRINVFKLNEKEKKWVKLANIGDRVLFLGWLCSFSVSASDLCVRKRNCVIIMDNIFNRYCKTSFLDLDDGRVLDLSSYPKYSKLFRTPRIKKLN
ncbi:hypothetical protein MtrunA17_Chr1g0146401 [Medicago truncatula]|uniref:F-box protein n=1 Tax=Medicago truncatula TaxID=3880 RepID=G7I272_MEDTR|nr:F-box protein SKIP23 [Medicago truncatula]AES58690.2 F-box protein [Medicago truncatula]RHN76670.1 hypothetical protein MtrunA17_Chr1g0146401 [Medicago truncatula]